MCLGGHGNENKAIKAWRLVNKEEKVGRLSAAAAAEEEKVEAVAELKAVCRRV